MQLGHNECLSCGIEGLRGVERFAGICFACNRNQANQKPPLDDSPRYNFSDDEEIPRDRKREF